MRRSTTPSGAAGPCRNRWAVPGVVVLALSLLTACGNRPKDLYQITATVSGLVGSGLVLQVNGGNDVAVTANGQVTLARMADGIYYSVTVKTPPANPVQTCTVTNEKGTVSAADVTNVAVDCVTTHAIGGTVSGLLGMGLVLHTSLGEDLPVTANGAFVFAGRAAANTKYLVKAGQQPSSPLQVCSVGNAEGTIGDADVLNIAVVCSTSAFQVGGTVTGLAAGTTVVLQNNGTDALSVTNSGAFTFTQPVADGATYEVKVNAQPTNPWQTCNLEAGTDRGTISGTAATTVRVTCTTNQYAIVGSISGLTGTGLQLATNGEPDLTVGAGATAFTFVNRLASGSPYAVTVKNQPTNPGQFCWVTNDRGTIGGADITNVIVTCELPWTSVAAGSSYTVAIKVDGTLWAWGLNSSGQLGDGTTTDQHAPKQIGTDHWASVAAGSYSSSHTVAIKVDGTLWAWGSNSNGELGDGTTTDQHAPKQIGIDHWASVAAGSFHAVAVKTDGTLWAWGFNCYGQLGDGTTTDQHAPKQIGSDHWTSVAAGTYHTVAVKTDGTLWAWGYNYHGELGDGTTTDQHAPKQIRTDLWASGAAGAFHNAAVKTDGTLWAWGWNFAGQLGDGTTTDQHAPKQIGIDHWASVAAGTCHTVAVKADGTLWAWGTGLLGDGTTANKKTLVPIGTDHWASVSAGHDHTVAVKADGTLWTWGYNGSGQLGDGTTTDQYAPERIR